MSRRPSRGQVTLFFSTLFLLGAAFLAGWTSSGLLGRYGGTLTLPGGRALVPPSAYREGSGDIPMALFWEAMGHLDDYYAQEELPRGADLTYAAIDGVVEATGDPYSAFMDPERAEIVRSRLEGAFEGIGVYIEIAEEGLTVVSAIPESPAEEVGLRSGDILLEVDGRSLAGVDLEEAVTLLRGPIGSTVALTVRRPGAPELLDLSITRARVPIVTVESRLLERPGEAPVGYLKLNRFGSNSAREVRDGLQSLLDGGAETLVVDLRNNGGGLLQAAIDISSQFIGDGVILSEQGSNGRDRTYNARGGGIALDIPVVVLINEGSASASEILAGAIRDRDRGTLIGTTSFGKGSVQVTHDLSDGSSIRVTVARWFTPSGEAIHEVGIEPDIVVTLDPDQPLGDLDPQLEAALDYLHGGPAVGATTPSQPEE